jgi:hypothetical protein
MLKNDLHYEMTVFPLGHKTVRCKECGDSRHSYTEKGIDVALATTMLVLANNRAFETAILVSGDKDYLETVKAVKQLGMRVEVVSWKRSLSQDLAKESSQDRPHSSRVNRAAVSSIQPLRQPLDGEAPSPALLHESMLSKFLHWFARDISTSSRSATLMLNWPSMWESASIMCPIFLLCFADAPTPDELALSTSPNT